MISEGYLEQEQFIENWPIERVKNLTLEDYTNLDKETSFIYWLEVKTNNTGGISGGSAFKFGVYRRKDNKFSDYKDIYSTDGVYGWMTKYGDDAESAFETVKTIILDIIDNSIRGNFKAIDDIDMGDAVKWKIAFLYNTENLLPVFKHEMLEMSAELKGLTNARSKTISELQTFLISKKDEDTKTLAEAEKIWTQFNLNHFYPTIYRFLQQAETTNLKKQGYKKKYKDLEVKVSFGAGNVARIPWIALLNPPNKVTDGIYPVYLYYKEINKLILAYGLSETNKSSDNWNISSSTQTIEEWYLENYGRKPARYGSSYIKAVYDLEEELSTEVIQNDLDEIISKYNALNFEYNEDIVNEDEEEYVTTKVWLVAPGEGAKKWDEFYDKGIIGLGWDKISDLKQYDDREQIRSKLIELYPEGSKTQNNNMLALWEFSNEMNPGDIIIPKRGINEYLGYGIVSSDYYYDESNEYPHLRKVDWKKKGVWPEEVHQIVLKTLTDITKYSEYVDRLKRLIGIGQEAVIPDKINYWWLNANPKYWKIDDFEVGQEQSYTTRNEKGNKRNKFEYFQKAKPGDLVIGYQSTPIKKVLAIYEITQGVHLEEDSGEEAISFALQKFLPDPISWSELKTMPELKDCEVLRNNQGSLFKLSKSEFDAIIAKEILSENPEYLMENALKELFIDETFINQILQSLEYKQNIILQGPPGTGKTYMAKKLAYLLMNERDNSKIEMVQFHQSYSYEDFMQGYRPKEDGSFKLENGVFYRFCRRAQADPSKKYFFIIDEINRGNLSKIFGELMLLIEKDKRGEKHQVTLTYAPSNEVKFSIPKNVYIIGTMNTADRSLAVVDYALRRRFAFIDILPSFNDQFKNHLINGGIDEGIVDKILERILYLNNIIKDDKNLGKGFQIGHSYFCNIDNIEEDQDWYNFIINHEIGPMLLEYWFDNEETAINQVQNLLD